MTGTGAPKGNQYAKKTAQDGTAPFTKRRSIGLYLTVDEVAILEHLLLEQGTDVTTLPEKERESAVNHLAREVFKGAVRTVNRQRGKG